MFACLYFYNGFSFYPCFLFSSRRLQFLIFVFHFFEFTRCMPEKYVVVVVVVAALLCHCRVVECRLPRDARSSHDERYRSFSAVDGRTATLTLA